MTAWKDLERRVMAALAPAAAAKSHKAAGPQARDDDGTSPSQLR